MSDIADFIKQFSDDHLMDYVGRRLGTRIRPGFTFSCMNTTAHPGGDQHPSANVFKAKDGHYWYHCYSCGLHGNLINVYKAENPSSAANKVTEIMQSICRELGIQMPALPAQKEISPILRAYRSASNYVKECGDLHGHLAKRKIDKSTAEKFAIGSIPDFETFTNYMTKHFTYTQLKEFGLANAVVFNDNNIIMTIHNRQGIPVAFVARNCGVVDDKHPKYCNTKTTEIYSKSETLFLFHDAKTAAIEAKSLYIVEGYIDAVTLHRTGIQNSCAMGGVALTPVHIEMAKSLGVNEIVFSWDNDPVGVKTTLNKVSEVFASCNGIRIRFIVVPSKYKDADGIITAEGKDAFLRLEKLDLLEYMATVLRPEPHDKDCSDYFQNIYENLRYISLNPFKMPDYVSRLSQATALPPESIRMALMHELKKQQSIADRYLTTLEIQAQEEGPTVLIESAEVKLSKNHQHRVRDARDVLPLIWEITAADATICPIIIATNDGYARMTAGYTPEQLAEASKLNTTMYSLRDVTDAHTFDVLADIRDKFKDKNYVIFLDLFCITAEAWHRLDRTRIITFNPPF